MKILALSASICWLLLVALFANYFWLNWVLKFSQKEQIEILKVIWLPFLILGSALPLTILLNSQLGKLYELKQALDSAPERLSASISKAEEFEDAIKKVSADAQNTLAALGDKFRADLETSAKQVSDSLAALQKDAEANLPPPVRVPNAQETEAHAEPTQNESDQIQNPTSAELRQQILAHVEPAAAGLYEKIDSWNSDGRRLRTGELIVSKGGGNRADIAALLAEKNLISSSQREYWSRAFQLELQTRKRSSTVQDVAELDALAGKA